MASNDTLKRKSIGAVDENYQQKENDPSLIPLDENKPSSAKKKRTTAADSGNKSKASNIKTANTLKKPSQQTCTRQCRKGKKSGCAIQVKKRTGGNLTCREIDEMLAKMGVSSPSTKSLCVKAAIMKGYIKITGDPSELEQVIMSEEGECGHMIDAKLRALLEQPDYAGMDYEDGLENATVICSVEDCYEGRTYVTGICTGNPQFDCGKSHNHCIGCPGFGQCIGDYREAHCKNCGKHYFQGLSGMSCHNCKRR